MPFTALIKKYRYLAIIHCLYVFCKISAGFFTLRTSCTIMSTYLSEKERLVVPALKKRFSEEKNRRKLREDGDFYGFI